ncbi:helicase-related protein [Terrihabitans soli]|nr:helicase-related protein [Terrihabitans soli]
MPKSLFRKNFDELLRFTNFTPDQICILDGTPAQIAKKLKSGAIVFIMGFTRFGLEARELWAAGVRSVDVDEIHMGFGGATSQRTQKFMASAGNEMDRFIAMTGTLIDGRLDTAYPSIKVINPRFYPSHHAFMAYHSLQDENGKPLVWRNHEKLSKIFGTYGIRHTFEEIHGPEAKVIEVEPIEMHPRQREMYDKFHDDALLELDRFFVDGSEPGVATIRARQIMEHPNFFPDLTNPGAFTDILKGELPGKLDRLDVHLADHERSGKPLIIFSALQPQQRQIVEMVKARGMSVALINGDVPEKRRAEIDRDFQAGKIQVVVGSPATAAVGFNWQFWGSQEVEHMIFVSMDYKDTNFIQAYRRAIRGKRKTFLRITIFEYEHSLDQRIFSIHREKSEMAKLVDPTRERLTFSRYRVAAA